MLGNDHVIVLYTTCMYKTKNTFVLCKSLVRLHYIVHLSYYIDEICIASKYLIQDIQCTCIPFLKIDIY